MDKKDKRKKILKVSGLIGLFLLVFGLSYALFQVTLNGTKKVKVKTGKLELQLLDENDSPIYVTGQNNESSFAINLDNQVPVDDETGLSTTGFTFKLKNTGSIDARYTIYLDDVALDQGETRIDDQYVKYSLTKNGTTSSPALLSTTVVNNERKLDSGIIEDDETNTYTLKIWIDEEATNAAMDKVFNATLRVEGVQYVAPPANEYGTKIAETQLSDTITATYYQPEETGYTTSEVKRMSNIKKIDNATTYEGGTLVISGEGEIPDYDWDYEGNFPHTEFIKFLGDAEDFDSIQLDENYYPILKYNPTNLVIEEGITRIGDFAFDYIASIENITFPKTLSYIGIESLSDCGIKELEIFGTNLEIATDAFINNENLTRVFFGEGITKIGRSIFDGSINLKEIYLSKTIVEVSDNPFYQRPDVIYCETQEVAGLLDGKYNISSSMIVVDPTKFE